MHELRLLDIQKKYKDKEAVRKFNYTFTNGVYGLLGENGAGKTTLMRLICGVLQPTGGSIYCDNIEIVSMGAEYRKLLGYLPQDFGCWGLPALIRIFFGGIIWIIVDSMPIFLIINVIINDIYEIWYIVLGISICFAVGCLVKGLVFYKSKQFS